MSIPNTATESPTAPTRVLLVEDDPLVARAVKRALRPHAIEVTHAMSKKDVLALREQLDLGIFDIDLPDSNGVELAELCVTQGQVAQVVFFSGTENPGKVTAARRLGELIGKAEGVQRLVAHVVAACHRPSGVYGKPTLG